MAPTTLQAKPSKDDDSWRFTVSQEVLLPSRNAKQPGLLGKLIKFTADAITLDIQRLPSNRILQTDDRSKFILLSFGDLRFPETPIKATGDYISRLFKAGLFLNGVQYRFYHHSNSQLRSRSCFLREANSDAELDDRIYRLGDFQRLMSAAKRAKRIGLLFSEAQLDYNLNPNLVKDIEDIQLGDELFSDGCGLISKYLAVELAKSKKIIFRGVRYTPCVFQIRPKSNYTGVLMLHPKLDEIRRTTREQNNLIHFRYSMKKFTATQNTTFSVVDHSAPYSFGRLNNDIIVLLSSLGISDDALLAKQEEYFQWIRDAATEPVAALDFLSCLNEYSLAERVLLDGIDDPKIAAAIRSLQSKEIGSFKNDRNKDRSRMIVKKSRLIFGVCDPFGVLKEGEVYIRITTARKGPSTPIHADVLVVRNPCLHPGDCLKLRAVHRPELSHLVDCIVFAGVAKPGHKAAPSMSSGGDLDGDKYFVCWDPDLVPSTISESYDYPPNREPPPKSVTRMDLATHFASYNSAGLARVAALHAKWVRGSPLGALSPECQELNALHSQSVDGAAVKIPDRLTTPPVPPGGDDAFVINKLASAARKFAEEFSQSNRSAVHLPTDDPNAGKQMLSRLLQTAQHSLSEYELFTLAFGLSRKLQMSREEFIPYLAHLDFGAFTTAQKYAIAHALDLEDQQRYPFVWNSLIRSDILTPGDLYARSLNQPFSLQRLYSSKLNGLGTFFFYLRMATSDFTRKLLVLKTDDRFAVGIFMRGELPWDEDPEVNDNVVVCSFMDKTSSNFSGYRPCTSGYRLHCSDTNFQLYDKARGNTFIFMTRPPAASGAELAVSIAVQKISARVQRQVGRINRTPVTAIELHVVSNRDRIAHQLFDMWFEHVPTENRVRRFERQAAPYHLNDIKDIEEEDWQDIEKYPLWLKAAFHPRLGVDHFQRHLHELSSPQLDQSFQFSLKYHLEDETFWIFNHIIGELPLRREVVMKWMETYPPLVFSLLKVYPPLDSYLLPDETSPLAAPILYNLIRSANTLRVAVLVALEKISATVAALPLATYFDLLWLTAGSVRSQELVQEVLLVLNDCRLAYGDNSDIARRYGEKHALAIAFDRAEEAFEECPCDEDGKPKRQRTAPAHTKLSYVEGEEALCVRAPMRIDAKSPVRLHSHVRLQAASKPDNRWIESIVLDGVVVQSTKGELKIELMHPPPPEMEIMDFNLYNAGSTGKYDIFELCSFANCSSRLATSKAMMEALLRLLDGREESCRYYSMITGTTPEMPTSLTLPPPTSMPPESRANLNQSQITAIESTNNPLCLVWGPPGKLGLSILK
ncbi:RNA dependent RNA polymerase-domain-containing protein [Mycena haematopus]|nr:RNA dependent RNA polymerase-domain-containing protein [Mycena haematopus]